MIHDRRRGTESAGWIGSGHSRPAREQLRLGSTNRRLQLCNPGLQIGGAVRVPSLRDSWLRSFDDRQCVLSALRTRRIRSNRCDGSRRLVRLMLPGMGGSD